MIARAGASVVNLALWIGGGLLLVPRIGWLGFLGLFLLLWASNLSLALSVILPMGRDLEDRDEAPGWEPAP